MTDDMASENAGCTPIYRFGESTRWHVWLTKGLKGLRHLRLCPWFLENDENDENDETDETDRMEERLKAQGSASNKVTLARAASLV